MNQFIENGPKNLCFPLPPKGGGVRLGPGVLNAADRFLYPKLHERAVKMRYNPTPAEEKMWELVKGKKLGVKFRRQHPIAKFIVDFYCVEKVIVVEVDGGIHDSQKEYDKFRDDILDSLGCLVLRFSNEHVLSNHVNVINKILIAINSR